MYNFSIEEGLKKVLQKLSKKDKVTYEILMKKIEEIISTNNLNHYKNLKSPLQEFKRVHVRGSFVLIFKFLKSENTILFYDFSHHDSIYINNDDNNIKI